MKILSTIVLLALLARTACSQEEITEKQFAELVAGAGDTKVLRPEIASLPHFTNANGTVVCIYADGNVIRDKCKQTAKTINGDYIVYRITSDSQKEPAYAVVGYDEKASTVRMWSLYNKALVEGTIIVDAKRKILASSATFGGNLMQLTVQSFSDKEEFERSSIYKDGVLFMTQEVKIWPIASAKEVEQPGPAQPDPKPADKVPAKPQPSTPTSKVSPR